MMLNFQEISDAGDAEPLSVSELNSVIKNHVENTPLLSSIVIKGQVSGNKQYPSGHSYFSLVDSQNAVKCVLFKNGTGHDYLENGAQVLVYGRVTYYERRGELNINVRAVQPYGLGAVQKEFEVLKAKLEKEGLFDTSRKRELPKFPQRVAVLTSSKSAALQDILNVFETRYPLVTVIVVPVTVGGESATQSIIDGFKLVSQLRPDVCILARGGGAPEELWPFNDERLARSIFALPVPIITGIGHQTDITIADYVADQHAPSPSAAAERATPDRNELKAIIHERLQMINNIMNTYLNNTDVDIAMLIDRLSVKERFGQHLEQIRDTVRRYDNAAKVQFRLYNQQLSGFRLGLIGNKPDASIALKQILQLTDRARKTLTYNQGIRKTRNNSFSSQLESLSPKKVLRRGYSIATLANGAIVKDAVQVKKDDILNLELYRGQLRVATVAKREAQKIADLKKS